jgi:hypothetical protein
MAHVFPTIRTVDVIIGTHLTFLHVCV